MTRAYRWLLLGALLASTGWMVYSTLGSVRFLAQKDEGVYLAYASSVAQQGPAAFPRLFAVYLRDLEANRYFPSPLRLLTVTLGAVAVRAGGENFNSLAVLSLVAFLAVLAMMFWGIRRVFGWSTAWWTLLLACAAPLHLAFSRRALSDTLVSAVTLLSLGLFLRAIWRPEEETPARRWGWVAAAYTAAFLVKESTALLVPVSFFFLGWRRFRTGRPLSLWPLCAVSVVPAAAAGGMMILAAGGVDPFLRTAAAFSGGASLNPYAMECQQGPWFRFIVDLLLISPWPVLLYLAWLGALIQRRNPDERDWFWALVPVLFIAMVSLVPAGKNVRFVIFLEMPMRLCSVLLLQRLAGAEGRNGFKPVFLVGAAVLFFAMLDLETFRRFFVLGGLYDPISRTLFYGRGFLPPP